MSALSIIPRVLNGKALWSAMSPLSRLLPAAAALPSCSAVARLHVDQRRLMPYTPPSGPRRWPRYNRQVFEPTAPEEPQRPAFICHVKTNVKYSRKKMWYVSSMIRGMSVEEALKQLQFVNLKGAKIAAEAIREAQEMAIQEHNVEFKTNLWVAESFATKGRVLTGWRRHARGRMCRVKYGYIHYFLRLEEGAPPAQYYVDAPLPPEQMLKQWLEKRRDRVILHSL